MSYDLKGGALYRLPFLLPYAISGTAIASIWQFMLVRNGAINGVLESLGLESLTESWLLRAPKNTYAMIVASTWQAVGVSVLLFLIGLQVIPKDPIEAARLDGAEGWRLFRDITFPLLRPMTIVTVGISLVNSLKTFDIIWIMTQGGPARNSETLAVTMYRETFVIFHHGYGAAIAVVLSIIVLLVSWLYLRRSLERELHVRTAPSQGIVQAFSAIGRLLRWPFVIVGAVVDAIMGILILILPGRIVRHGLLLILGLAWILPVYLFLVNAVSSSEEYAQKERWAPPKDFALADNISDAWTFAHLGQAIGSTLFYAIVGALLAVLIAALAAFALASLRVPHAFFWFMVIYAGTIFPFQMYLSPLYKMFTDFELYNTHQGLLIFYTAIAIPFATFVIRNHFISIPSDLSEAARLDGASALVVFFHIFVPLSLNAFATVFILQFTWIWNDLLFGLTLSKDEEIRPIMTALAALQGQYSRNGPPVALAGALLVSLPTIALFFAVQRVFVRGLRTTA
jgi:multiple sugar transport system permease protein